MGMCSTIKRARLGLNLIKVIQLETKTLSRIYVEKVKVTSLSYITRILPASVFCEKICEKVCENGGTEWSFQSFVFSTADRG